MKISLDLGTKKLLQLKNYYRSKIDPLKRQTEKLISKKTLDLLEQWRQILAILSKSNAYLFKKCNKSGNQQFRL
jgi:hypothetical protein